MSSATRSTPGELAAAVGEGERRLAGLLRRMIVTRTTSAIWQVQGHRLLDDTLETRDAEVFAGVGIAARPSSDDDVEAIVAFPQGGAGPIIVATRQEAVRRVMAADLDADETQLHNSEVLIRIRANGTVEIRSKNGTAQELATKADVVNMRVWLLTHTHSGGTILGNTGNPLVAPPAVVGTSVLKAE